MKKRGFTLIELLAVIVILAIIALIATPIVMNVIKNTRKGAAERSAENYLRAVETAIAAKRLDGPVEDGTYTVDSNGNLSHEKNGVTFEIEVEVSGTKPAAQSGVQIENGQVNISGVTLFIGNYTVKDTNRDGKLEATKTEDGEIEDTVAVREANAYLSAVEAAIDNGLVPDGTYKIISDGKIQSKNDPSIIIVINTSGTKPTNGIIEIENGEVIKISNLKVNNIYIVVVDNKSEAVEASTLVTGKEFNTKVKNLVNNSDSMASDKIDYKIKSVQFYSNGELPEGKTKNELENLPNVSVSADNKVIAYNDNGKIYIYSDNQISFNEDSSEMFRTLGGLTKLDLNGINTRNVTNMSYMFGSYYSAKPLDLSGLDTSSVTDMSYMFHGYNSSESLYLSKLDTSNVTTMSYMFHGYNSSESLYLSKLDTSDVTTMSYMFYSYRSAKSLDLSGLDTSDVADMSYMFSYYSSTAALDLSGLHTSNVTDISSMFSNFQSETITSLDLTNFNTTKVTNMASMFKNASKITEIKGTEGKWVVGSKTKVTDMFTGCGTDHVTIVSAS